MLTVDFQRDYDCLCDFNDKDRTIGFYPWLQQPLNSLVQIGSQSLLIPWTNTLI